MTLRKSQIRGCSKPRSQSVDADADLGHSPRRLIPPIPWPHDPATGWPHDPANRHLAGRENWFAGGEDDFTTAEDRVSTREQQVTPRRSQVTPVEARFGPGTRRAHPGDLSMATCRGPARKRNSSLATMTGASDFKGTLDLYNGVLSESGGGMTARI
jgi:hypothetical protein